MIHTNYVAPGVYEFIADCTSYEESVQILWGLCNEPKNEIYARYLLATRKQESGKSLDQFLQVLKCLSEDCIFVAVNVEQNGENYRSLMDCSQELYVNIFLKTKL